MARNAMLIVGLLFGAVAVILLVAAGVLTAGSVSFRSTAVSVEGTIVDVEEGRDCDNGRCQMVYSPVVEFATDDGRSITFVPNYSSSNEPQVGNTVTVLYPPSDPQGAKIDNFLDFWLAPAITGGLGVIFAGVGIPISITQLRRRRLDAWLTTNGQPITAKIAAVDWNRSVRINRRHPWQVTAYGIDPTTGNELRFVSANLMADPRPALADARTVEVLVDPRDPARNYRMDLSAFGIDD